MGITAEEIVSRIEAGIEGTTSAVATDLGGGNHWRAEVVASGFEGKTLVERHQMIYALFKDKMLPRDESIHALSLKTVTPAEAS